MEKITDIAQAIKVHRNLELNTDADNTPVTTLMVKKRIFEFPIMKLNGSLNFIFEAI
ncbi:hypothetical protein [Chryseobacterium carnipullorum]|uniref:Uncharacterized protein n=1 Tax=Chryseobacterium carnipullorum TaxID=1124835 RepID=A0A376DTS2_CHRCU|nr:hypothetical protein [Chryseobacterium carnipullorum]STC94269.1 Uncharacterised protein [Chryseobacterium carnipullorum]